VFILSEKRRKIAWLTGLRKQRSKERSSPTRVELPPPRERFNNAPHRLTAGIAAGGGHLGAVQQELSP
jgi:3'-phosphoadenosine 5'-phosphosulfate sulfotransferase (PAPS reductase)/FAD synthetase